VLLGSNVTHQYNERSDIDVNVMAIKGESFDDWHKIFKDFNNRPNLLPGTEHPINFYFQEYVSPSKLEGWDNSLGAYDIMFNKWLKHPAHFERIGDPKETYAQEITYVSMMMRMVESEVHAIRQAIKINDEPKALNSLKVLQRFFKQLDQKRKDSFRYSGGSPSTRVDNLIFKMIQHGPYGDLLEDLIGD
jgi:hypothetical protein